MSITLLRIIALIICLSSSVILQAQNFEWQRLEGMEGSYITSITQTQSGAIFIGTPYALWRSRDSLKTWEKISLGARDSLVYGLASTADGGLLISTYKGVYRSSDDGITWSTVTPSSAIKKWRYIYAHSSGVCFAGADKRLFRSTNHGRSWSSFGDTILQLSYIKRQLPTPVIGQDGRIILRNYYMDNDQKWQRNAMPNSLKESDVGFGGLIASTTDEKGTIVYGWRKTIPSEGSVSISRDNGVSFEFYRYDIEPQNPGSEFLFTRQDLLLSDILYNQSLIVGDTVLLSYFGRGIFKSPLNKNHPFISPKDMTYNGANTQHPTCLYKLHNGIILMGSYGNGLFRSDDNGTNWKKINVPFHYPIITHIVNDEKKNILYASTMNGLYSSTDTGLQWKREDSGFFRPCITKVFCLDDGKVFAINHDRVYRKDKDNGRWYNVNLSDIRTITGILHINDTVCLFNDVKQYSAGKEGKGPYIEKTIVPMSVSDITYVPLQKTFVVMTTTPPSTPTIMYSKDNLKSYSLPFQILKEITLNEVTSRYAAFLFLRSSPYSSRVYCGTESGIFALDTKDNYYTPMKKNDEWLDNKFIFDIAINQLENAYAVTDGLYILPSGKNKWEQLETPPQIASPMLLTAIVDPQSYLYTSSIYGGIFRTVTPTIILDSPVLKVPSDNAQQIPMIDAGASWNPVKSAKQYRIQLSKTADFSTIIYQDSNITVNNAFFPTLQNNTKYYWRVQAQLFGIKSPWSQTRSFSTVTVYPTKVTLRQPVNKDINRPVSLSLLWNPATEADSFDVHVATDNGFTMTAMRDSMIAKREIQLSNLQQGTEYFWRVRGKNRAGYGPWSDTWSFTTQSPSAISEENNSGVQINIVNKRLLIDYHPYSQSMTGLRITDIRGKTVYSTILERGQSSADIDLSAMSKGYYVVILEGSTGTLSRNIIVE